MILNSCRLFLLVITLASFALLAAPSSIHAQPSGGKLPPEAGPVTAPKTGAARVNKTATRLGGKVGKPKTTNPPRSAAARSPRSSLAIESIEGKWWTTGNGFGDSEVLFTQTGPRVSGVIRYADGRTGSIEGTLVGKRLQHSWTNSSGDGGTGWLELSWSNFLGGPWHNQRVRDGSWTLTRLEGKWCFGGSRSRIRTLTHDARGRITLIAEDGTGYDGRLEGPFIYLDSDFGSIEGTMNFKSNRVDWSSGFFWTWCGR